MKGHVMVFDMKEAILDNILGHDHVGLTILYCLRDILAVLTIWKWSLAQTIMEGFLLKELLLSYDESYVLEVDVEGMIGLKKKKYGLSKRKMKGYNVHKFCFKNKKGAKQIILLWSRGGNVLFMTLVI